MTKNYCKLSTMVEENVEIYLSQINQLILNYHPRWLEIVFTIYFSQMAKNHYKLSIMVGEKFTIYLT